MTLKSIRIRGAREHNLKNIDVDIPRDQLVVITGLSGSGKSTLAFDTVYAEGQRKYIESLSAYARQFLDQLQKPDIDEIEGLPPTIAIEQRSASSNPRSTVATTTEIYDYLRVLFARAGTPHCWICGRVIASQTPSQIVDSVMRNPPGTKVMILSPLVRGMKGEHKDIFGAIHKQGFVRARVDGEIHELQKPENAPALKKTFTHNIEAVVDRIVLKPEIRSRLADSIETALKLSQGLVIVAIANPDNTWTDQTYSEKFACPEHPEVSLPELEPRLFSFNSPHGACPACHGLGTTCEFDPEMIVPDESVSLENGAIEAWRKHGKRMNIYYSRVLRQFCRDFGVSYTAPFKDIPKKIQQVLMYGTDDKGDQGTDTWFEGVIPNLQRRFENTESEFVKTRLHQYMSEQPCATCNGTRLKKEVLAVRLHTLDDNQTAQPPHELHTATACGTTGVAACGVTEGVQIDPARPTLAPGKNGNGKPEAPSKNGKTKRAAKTVKPDSALPASSSSSLSTQHSALSTSPPRLPGYSIDDVTRLTVERARQFFQNLRLSEEGEKIAEPIHREIAARLGFMFDVGLGYLTLDRKTATLSGGEAQRIRLATQVGSGLVGVCYVLDEPTIGLHQRDNTRLIRTLKRLQSIGNTVLMVEHDEDCIRAADYLIDIGPGAGAHGGTLVAAGKVPDVFSNTQSTTIKYLTGEYAIATPTQRRRIDLDKAIELKGCRENNLKNVDVRIPLGGLICITGVSGSGKSTLINQTLLPALKRKLYNSKLKAGVHKSLNGINRIDKVIEIDQSPIGRTSRSNPATYTGMFDEVRKVFAKTREAKIRGYEPGRFSFNVKGGRCEACQGQGTKCIEMHFLPDIYVNCEVCRGTRYNAETLEIHYRSKNIAQVLDMTTEEALTFFENHPPIYRMLKALNDVGLGYVKLGQPSTQLSGGEAQRVKLASELGKNPTGHTLYVLDEPTTGLHFADIHNLLNVLNRLADLGNTVLVIEHNLDVIKSADWLIDMGPEGGDAGGRVIAEGTPEQIADTPGSYTGEYLKPKLLPAPVPARKMVAQKIA
ncbi:MAG TPA: excinuclease ABC subunit UvrA [Tepidisphaeraceae bacterium]|jgi:excinuclease ABC subunit A|nr:excinuclease ABC subunit UvrA [Tepidisphaeraceae bacterium]